MFASIISQVTPSESSVIKKVAYEPLFLATCETQLGVKGMRRVVMHERLTNLRPVIFLQFADGHAAHRSLARAARRLHPAIELRQDRHRGERGHRSRQHGRGAVVARLPHQSDRGHAHRAATAAACRARNTPATRPTPACWSMPRASAPMPPLALPTREYMEHARALWEELGLPRSTCSRRGTATRSATGPTRWETFARRATAGDWEVTGRETLAAPARRTDARDARPFRRAAEEIAAVARRPQQLGLAWRVSLRSSATSSHPDTTEGTCGHGARSLSRPQ